MKSIHIKAKFQLTESFCHACEVAGTTPEAALQKFINSVTIEGYLQEFNKSSAKLSGEFIRLSFHNLEADGALLKNDTIRAQISMSFFQKIASLRSSDRSPEDKKLLYKQLIADWFNLIFD
ncbi:hypothetical protein SAMN05421788_113125 [Filimonas lacunae]|uniref:Uncharacterized protein n=1 Tax=Filimonas lacunae TaxID=477680 RepID=A0A1N7RFH8_9BACT|nr:hypothetical protein [Filimonas lacunae]SIT33792.1 hypothetical protein SAMN05421788_113125 [Filimonas lacunae]